MINVTEEMKHLNKLAREDSSKRFVKLWRNLCSIEWLVQAWEQIRRNKGSQTAGIDKMTDEKVDFELIHRLAEKLKQGTYRPKAVRRVHIPKTNGKTRPLGIPTLEDRIVQQGLKMLLEPIFEADFRRCSHGFRQGKSPHTALRDVARVYPNVGYVIEGDIKSCFDNIPHGKLIEQISRRIADEKILQICWKFLRAGYMEQWNYHRTYSGTPQGGIISPLFANIFLHQIDEWMEDELRANIIQTKKDEISRRNPAYSNLTLRIWRLRQRLLSAEKNHREIISQIQDLEKERKKIPLRRKDVKHPGKIWYTRYADDFVVMMAGDKDETQNLKAQVTNKLSEIGLTLSDEKTRITHWSKPVRFLGYNIRGVLRDKGVTLWAYLTIPKEKQKQISKRIQTVCNYFHIPETDVLTQISAIYRGWCNYYKYANAPQKVFNRTAYKMWWEYAHYNARKHKTSIKQMVVRERKAGRLKTVEKNGRERNTFTHRIGEKEVILDIFPPSRGQIQTVGNRVGWEVDLQPVNKLNWVSGRSLMTRMTALERAKGLCEKCREQPVHHVHHTRPMRGKSFLARVQSDRDQKETAIALCQECHLEKHQGSFKPRRKSELERRIC